MAKSKPIEIDILDMEMSKGLPHWLDPIEKYKGTFDERRKQNQIKHANELRAEQKKARLKSQWKREKARALALLGKAFDPGQPRDEYGRWVDTGGSDAEGGQRSSSSHAKDPTSASSLLRIDKSVTVDDLHNKVPGSREQDLLARARLRTSRETDKIYKLPSGQYAPDRLPTHRAIINELMPPEQIANAVPARGEKPTLYILGGRGGSGKGWFTGKNGTIDPSTSVYINNDDVKEALPEYKGWNAGHVHEEASHIGETMEDYARDNKLNVIVDATLKSGPSLEKRIALYKAAGYKISGHYMYASPTEAATRALGRFVSGNKKNGKGRFVPPEYSLESTTNEHTFDSHRDSMDYWEVYDNMGKAPVLHSRKG